MNIGIIGTGRIARRFVSEAKCVKGIRLSGVYNPHEGSAQRFAAELLTGKSAGADNAELTESSRERLFIATDSIEELFAASDAVYIASPHETHYGYIVRALTSGKHVLCEKPMALERKQAEECFRLADEKELVLMEALKTAYCPGYRRVLEAAKSGVVGEIRYIYSCFTKLENPAGRELTAPIYGGSFIELGSYVLLPILDLFGDREISPQFSSIRNDLGLDLFTIAEINLPDRKAMGVCGLGIKAEGQLILGGTKGFIKAEAPWWKTSRVEVHFEDPDQTTLLQEAFEGDGLRYEIARFKEAVLGNDDLFGREEIAAAGIRSVLLAGMMESFLEERAAL